MKKLIPILLALSIIGLFCNKNDPVPNTPKVVNPYSVYWGIWVSQMSAGGKAGIFKLLLLSDTTFSFSQIMDSTGVVSLSASGSYSITGPDILGIYDSSAAKNLLKLFNNTYTGYYQFHSGPINMDRTLLNLTWVSGHDFMNASNPATTTWNFHKQ
jgi:hypothetical protein